MYLWSLQVCQVPLQMHSKLWVLWVSLMSHIKETFLILAANMFFNMCCCCRGYTLCIYGSKAPVIVQSRLICCVCVGISCPTCAHHALFALPEAVNPLNTCLCSTILLWLYHLFILVFSGQPHMQICICMLSWLSAAKICLFYITGCDDAWWKGYAHALFSQFRSCLLWLWIPHPAPTQW